MTKMGITREDATLKLPVFHGTGRDNVEKHWFTCKVIWEMKQTPNDQAKMAQLETMFREGALSWYMKFKATTPSFQVRTLAEIKQALLKEFQKPKPKSQCIAKIKEIKQVSGESVWDFDQRFKVLLDRLTFQIPNAQHCEWFIARLLPHICIPLM